MTADQGVITGTIFRVRYYSAPALFDIAFPFLQNKLRYGVVLNIVATRYITLAFKIVYRFGIMSLFIVRGFVLLHYKKIQNLFAFSRCLHILD